MSKQVLPDEDFVITDPEQQPGVVLEVEPGIRPVMLLDGYLSEKIVRCSFCKQRQWHRKGIFALLPDGSKALCGHCCAVGFTDKSTVAKIEKDLDIRVKKSAQRKVSAAVTSGIPELLEALDRDFMRVHRELNEVFNEMESIFPSMKKRARSGFGYARGGLIAIVKASDHKLSDSQIESILKKRSLANEIILKSLSVLREGISAMRHDRIRASLPHLASQD
ncbi:hypothetical protein ACEWPM_015715 [Roseovarius sp. S4756]|uniref:hypothetical protein n=1 Tax=Roseovarius maritimus TaxID=3342637 RepID=UPI00372A4207